MKTDHRTHECVLCHRTFKSSSGLQMHVKAKHGRASMNELTCIVCDEDFASYGDLQAHMDFEHGWSLSEAEVDFLKPAAKKAKSWPKRLLTWVRSWFIR
jgi:hypothetical protein